MTECYHRLATALFNQFQAPLLRASFIRADAESQTGDVQKLIQICQKAGYEKFSLKAMQPEGK